MSDALTQALVRRERIVQRIARQRDSVALAVVGLRRPIAVIDRIAAAGRVLRAYPAAAIALVAGVVVLRTRSVIGLVGRGIGLWHTFRKVRALIEHLAQ